MEAGAARGHTTVVARRLGENGRVRRRRMKKEKLEIQPYG
jgi:hypothetical protein